MKLVIGLGNPGEKYKNNRHNAGFLVVDQLKTTINNLQFIIYKSSKFMNDSGSFVKSLSIRCSLSPNDLFIVHDDLDIKLGDYKIQFGKGPKGHNGILDIEEKLGTSEFWRVRVGVDNRDITNRISGDDYVLEDFTEKERVILNKVINEICRKLETL